MFSFWSLNAGRARPLTYCIWCAFSVRSLSTKSAIQRGIRRSRPSTQPARNTDRSAGHKHGIGRAGKATRPEYSYDQSRSRGGPYNGRTRNDQANREQPRRSSALRGGGIKTLSGKQVARSNNYAAQSWDHRLGTNCSRQSGALKTPKDMDASPRHQKSHSDKISAPLSIPYTTPASEYLYGTSVVEAALSSNRRKLYKLYVHAGEHKTRHGQDGRIAKLAAHKGVAVEVVSGSSWVSLMDKMSGGRPHNGFCMEASRLQRPAVRQLSSCSLNADGLVTGFNYETAMVSREDWEIDGDVNHIEISTNMSRHPLVVLLDGVVDTGNLGGIIRSALFLGASAVAMSSSCGPLNPVVLKASAGAAESLPLIFVGDTTGFIEGSKTSGWKVFGSVAPPKPSKRHAGAVAQQHVRLEDLSAHLKEHPCILMIGGEGSGLKADLQRRADCTVSIANGSSVSNPVDSLNVSVATGILLERFLRTESSLARESRSKLW